MFEYDLQSIFGKFGYDLWSILKKFKHSYLTHAEISFKIRSGNLFKFWYVFFK